MFIPPSATGSGVTASLFTTIQVSQMGIYKLIKLKAPGNSDAQ